MTCDECEKDQTITVASCGKTLCCRCFYDQCESERAKAPNDVRVVYTKFQLTPEEVKALLSVSDCQVVRLEGSGECQSWSNVPDSAGATPAPSTICQCFHSIDGGGHEKDCAHYKTEPVIEQKPVCICCTIQVGDEFKKDPIRHDDPCRFTHLERYMLPIAKAQFRARQLAIRAASTRARLDAEDAAVLAEIENDRGGNYMTPTQEKTYVALTGHDFKAE
jgi:hypothetical protein